MGPSSHAGRNLLCPQWHLDKYFHRQIKVSPQFRWVYVEKVGPKGIFSKDSSKTLSQNMCIRLHPCITEKPAFENAIYISSYEPVTVHVCDFIHSCSLSDNKERTFKLFFFFFFSFLIFRRRHLLLNPPNRDHQTVFNIKYAHIPLRITNPKWNVNNSPGEIYPKDSLKKEPTC